jgi:hypothetical protein
MTSNQPITIKVNYANSEIKCKKTKKKQKVSA